MKIILGLIISWTFISGANAEGPRTVLYSGTSRIISLSNGSQSSQQVLLKKIYDVAASTLTEIACFKNVGKAAEILPVYMKVNGNSMQISDRADFSLGKLSGSGELMGTDWDWKYLKWSMKYQTPGGIVSVEDVNFVVGSQLIGRKQMFFNSHPFQFWEIEMNEMTQPSFDSQAKDLGCPAF